MGKIFIKKLHNLAKNIELSEQEYDLFRKVIRATDTKDLEAYVKDRNAWEQKQAEEYERAETFAKELERLALKYNKPFTMFDLHQIVSENLYLKGKLGWQNDER